MPLIEVLKPEKKMLTLGLCCAAIIILVFIFVYNNFKSGHYKLPALFKKLMNPFSLSSGVDNEKENEIIASEFVEDLTSETQLSEIFEPSSTSKILLVHTNWCGHCRNMMKAFNESAKLDESLLKNTKWYRIDGSVAPNFIKRKDLKGFPTIYGISANSGIVSQHAGARDVESLLKFSKSLSVSNISKARNIRNSQPVQQPREQATLEIVEDSGKTDDNNKEEEDLEESQSEESENSDEENVEEEDNVSVKN